MWKTILMTPRHSHDQHCYCSDCYKEMTRPEPMKRGRIFNHRDGMSELERFEMEQKPKSAEERADEVLRIYHKSAPYEGIAVHIAKAIQQAMDATREEALKNWTATTDITPLLDAARAEGWHDGFTKGFNEVNIRIPEIEQEAHAKGFSEGEESGCPVNRTTDFHKELILRGIEEGQAMMRERAAKVVEENDEVTILGSGKWRLEKKSSTNINGFAYAKAIRALPLSEAEGGKSE